MDQINGLIDRARVIATAAVTYILLAVSAIQAVLATVGDDIPEVAEYGGQAVAFLLGAVAIIRRVTPVRADDRGILPPGGGV